MSVYDGWQADLLAVAKLPDTAKNVAFLNDWHSSAESDCAFNPIDLTATNSHSHKCKDTGYDGRSYQRYESSVWTRTAFGAQIKSGKYPTLVKALESGDPYMYDDYNGITSDLGNWPSQTFAIKYLDARTGGPPPPVLKAPQALHGWHAIQQSVNRKMPAALDASQKHRHAALRELRRARKVVG